MQLHAAGIGPRIVTAPVDATDFAIPGFHKERIAFLAHFSWRLGIVSGHAPVFQLGIAVEHPSPIAVIDLARHLLILKILKNVQAVRTHAFGGIVQRLAGDQVFQLGKTGPFPDALASAYPAGDLSRLKPIQILTAALAHSRRRAIAFIAQLVFTSPGPGMLAAPNSAGHLHVFQRLALILAVLAKSLGGLFETLSLGLQLPIA
jgi:hypothetical protein